MKNKKKVLIIIGTIIIILAIILGFVLILGGITNQKLEKFHLEVEEAACNYVNKEYNNPSLLEAYSYLTKIKFATLINAGYLDENLKNPLTKEKISENTLDYIEITYDNSKYKCTFKEG